LATDGIVPTFGLWYDFRQNLPLEDSVSFYAECLEEIERAEGEDFPFIAPGVVYVREDSERARSDTVKA
jgi:hypothetical protein